jgi:hydrogenase expression/formation protein HypC
MCLTTPGQILKVDSPSPELRIAEVDFGVAVRSVNLVFTPEAKVGDFVIVHAGFATRRLPEEEAREALAYARELAALSSTPPPSEVAGGPA